MAVEFNQIYLNTEVMKSEVEDLKKIETRIGHLVVQVFECNESEKIQDLSEDLMKMKNSSQLIEGYSRETERLFQTIHPRTETELNKLMQAREGFDGLREEEGLIKASHDIEGIKEVLLGIRQKAEGDIRLRLEEISKSIVASENLEACISELRDVQENVISSQNISEIVRNEEFIPYIEREVKVATELMGLAADEGERSFLVLAPLTDEEMTATSGRSEFYSQEFKGRCPDYHRTGDSWSDEVAGEFFRKGLFQHYFAMKCNRYNCNLDYTEAFVPQGRLGFNERIVATTLFKWKRGVTKEKQIHDLRAFREIVERFSWDPRLLRMGAQFQREKIVLEKMESVAQRGSEEAFQELMKLDGICSNRQKVLFHWISDFSEKLINFLRSRNEMLEELIDPDEFELSMPEFFQNPDYSKFLKI
ncbi:MAG: hypothetical protein ACI8RA_001129 [Chlamydiales bacterium]|jgi:hypothetical protein